jgi:hypothetical protein
LQIAPYIFTNTPSPALVYLPGFLPGRRRVPGWNRGAPLTSP